MTPRQINDEWFVTDGSRNVTGPFKSNSEAWRWLDRHSGESINRAEDTADYVFRKMADGGAS